MAAIITEKFRQSSADSFKTSFGTDKYYLFVGKSQPWTSEGATTDSLPPAPVDSVAPESYYWDDMLAAKLIGTNNTTFAVPRRDYSTTLRLICIVMISLVRLLLDNIQQRQLHQVVRQLLWIQHFIL